MLVKVATGDRFCWQKPSVKKDLGLFSISLPACLKEVDCEILPSVLIILYKCIFYFNVWELSLARRLDFLSQPHTCLMTLSDSTNEYHNAPQRLTCENNSHCLSLTRFLHLLFLFWMSHHHRHVLCDVTSPLYGYTNITQQISKQNKKDMPSQDFKMNILSKQKILQFLHDRPWI